MTVEFTYLSEKYMNYTLIDKTDGVDPTIRDKHWRKVLETVTPYGSNTVD